MYLIMKLLVLAFLCNGINSMLPEKEFPHSSKLTCLKRFQFLPYTIFVGPRPTLSGRILK